MNNFAIYSFQNVTKACVNTIPLIHVKRQLLLFLTFLFIGLTYSFAQQPAANLDQLRNGSATSPVDPGNWVNGNLGAQNSHYSEGMSSAYRAIMTNMPASTVVTLTLEYDVKHSDRHALDYLTSYDRVQPHLLAYGHAQEEIDPTIGTPFTEGVGFMTFPIPLFPDYATSPVANQPEDSFNDLGAADKMLTMWNGTITNITYGPLADLSQSNAPQQLIVTFTTGASGTVLLAWGGHIASRHDWGSDGDGIPLSAGGISGSPYHMRLIDWNLNNLGNQDRSLSADAIAAPPTCQMEGNDPVCPDTENIYSIMPEGAINPTYTWELVANTSGAFFVGGMPANSATMATVNSGTSGGTYTVKVTIDSDNGTAFCDSVVTVDPLPDVDAGADQELTCTTTSLQLSGSTSALNATYLWTTLNGNIVNNDTALNPTIDQPGTYTLTITGDTGCVNSDDVIISQDAELPTADAGADQELTCTTLNVDLDGTGGSSNPDADLSYAWTGPNGFAAATEDVNVSAIGIYTLRVTDNDNGCYAEDTVEVTQDAELPTADAGADQELTCTTLNVDLDGTGGSSNPDADLSYAWTGPNGFAAATEDVNVSAIGIYTLRVTDNDNGCYAEDTVEVTQDAELPTADAGADQELTCTTLNVDLDGTGGSSNPDADLSYAWTGPNGFAAATEDVNVSAIGIYTLRVTDNDNGCYAEDTVEVTQDAELPTADAGADQELTCTTLNVDLDGTGGSSNPDADLSYAWTGPNGFAAATEDVNVSAIGIYTLRVTDNDNGCYAEDTVEVTQDAELPTADAGADQELTCTTLNVDLDGTGGSSNPDADLSYAWTGPNGFAAATEDVNVSAIGIYTLRVTDNDNGCYAEDTVEVTQDAELPTADAGADQELTCTTLNVDLDGTGGSSNPDADLSYAWTGPNGFAAATEDVNVSAIGIYTLRVTDNDNGCYAEDTVEVTQDAELPTADAGADQELTCTTLNVDLDGTGGSSNPDADLSYAWTGPNGFAAATEDVNVSAIGIYTLRVTDNDNGCYAEDTVEVTQDAELPTADAGADQELTCTTLNVDLDGTGGSSNPDADLSYAWTGPNGFAAATEDVNVSAIGIYTLRVTDNDNGCYAEDTVEVTQDAELPTADAGADQELTCTTLNVDLDGTGGSSNPDADLSYAWTGPNGFAAATEDVNVSAIGIYTLRVTDNDNGCYAEDTVEVTQDAELPTADAGADQELTCTTLNVDLDGTGGSSNPDADLSYAWTGPNGFAAATEDVNVSAIGIYTLRVTDNDNGCYAEDTVEVTQDAELPTADAGADQELTCTTLNVDLDGTGGSSNPDADLSYAWTGPNGFAAATEDVNVSAIGIYTLRVTDNDNGCYAEDTVEVTQDAELPTADAGADQELTCTTLNVDLDGTGGSSNPDADLSYAWTGPNGFAAATEDVNVSAIGIYTLRVTDNDNGCYAEDTVEVTQDAELPTADAGADQELTCTTLNVDLDGTGGSSNPDADLSYAWTGPNGFAAATEDVNVSAIGIYTLRVTDNDNGCYAEDTVEVTQDAELPTADAGADQELTCTTLNVDLDGTGGSSNPDADLSYAWTGPNGFAAATEDVNVSAIGIYTLRVTDNDNGCYAEDTVEVTQDAELPTADAGADQELTCTTLNVDLDGTGGSSNPDADLSYAWTGPNGFAAATEDVNVSAIGIYTLRVTDNDNGCYAEDTVEVTEDVTKPSSNAQGGELTCIILNVQLDGTGGSSNPDADLSYAWTGPNGFASAEEDPVVSEIGIYILTVTDNDNGCYEISQTEVTQDITTPEADATGGILTCSETSIQLDGSGSSSNPDADLSYAWTGPNGFASAEEDPFVDEPGLYNLIVTDNDNGCYDNANTEVTKEVLVLEVSSTNITCFGEADGTITVNSVSDGAIVTVNGELYNPDTLYGAGTYLVEAYFEGNDDPDCYINEEIEMTEPEVVSMTVTSTNTSCGGVDDGTITVSNLSEGATYTIQLNGYGADLSGQSTFAPGTYLVVAFIDTSLSRLAIDQGVKTGARYEDPCEEAVLVTIEDYACEIMRGYSGKVPDCKPSKFNYLQVNTTGGSGALTYDWSIDSQSLNYGWEILGATDEHRASFKPGFEAAIFTVTVTDEEGCITECSIKVHSACANPNQLRAPEKFDFEMYPNPTRGKLDVQFDKDVNSNMTVEVYNLVGTQMYSRNYKDFSASRLNIDFSGFPSQVYYLRITTDRGTQIKKVILNK